MADEFYFLRQGDRTIKVPSRDYWKAVDKGWRQETPEEAGAREARAQYGEADAAAALAGAARGLSFGVSDILLRAAGVERETLAGLRDANPIASGVGEVGAVVGSIFMPELLVAKMGAAGNLLKGPRAISSLAAKTGARVEGTLLRTAAGEAGPSLARRALAKVAGHATAGVTEGAVFRAGHALSEEALGSPDLVASSLIAASLRGAASGAMYGGLIGGVVGPGLTLAAAGLQKVTQKVSGFAERRLGQVSEVLARRQTEIDNQIARQTARITKAREEAAAAQKAFADQKVSQAQFRARAEKLKRDIEEATRELDLARAAREGLSSQVVQEKELLSAVGLTPAKLRQLGKRKPKGWAREVLRELKREGSHPDGGAIVRGADSVETSVARLEEAIKVRGKAVEGINKQIQGSPQYGELDEVFSPSVYLGELEKRLSQATGLPAQRAYARQLKREMKSFKRFTEENSPLALSDLWKRRASYRSTWERAATEGTEGAANREIYRLLDDHYKKAVEAVATPEQAAALVRANEAYAKIADLRSGVRDADIGALSASAKAAAKAESAAVKEHGAKLRELTSAQRKVDQEARRVERALRQAKNKGVRAERTAQDATTRIDEIRARPVTASIPRDPLGAAIGGGIGGAVGAGVGGLAGGGLGAMAGGIAGRSLGYMVGGTLTGGTAAARTVGVLNTLQKITINTSRLIDTSIDRFLKNIPRRQLPATISIWRKLTGERDEQKAARKLINDVALMKSDPVHLTARLSNVMGPVSEQAPKVGQAWAATMARSIEFAFNILPKPPQHLVPTTWEIPQGDLDRVGRRLAAIFDPMSVPEALEAGTLTSEQVRALKGVHPGFYNTLVAQALETIHTRGIELSAEQRNVLSILLDAPVDPVYSARTARFTQQMFAHSRKVSAFNTSTKPVQKLPDQGSQSQRLEHLS